MESETKVNVDQVIQYALGKVYEQLVDTRSLGVYDLQALVETLDKIRTMKDAQEVKEEVKRKE